MKLGFKLIAEAYGPLEIVEQAVRAEAAGFDFVEVSDHFHPWVSEHEHSGFAFSMLAAIAARTTQLELATGVTCPFIRYHPAVVAQMAATTAILSGGRFTLGVGAGERLNEHVVGAGWPAVATRHEMLREALEIIRLLWAGGYQSYSGKHLQLEDARVFDLPDVLPQIAVAAGGPSAARIAGELGDALFVTEPKGELITAYEKAGGSGPKYAEVPLAWAPSADDAAESARRLFRFGLTGWKVQAELPNPVNFDAATTLVTADHLREQFACGPDVDRHVEVARQFAEAGYDHLALINAGPDMDGFFGFFTDELGPALRSAVPASSSSR
ncbi:TIGR03557 family F420-dependent LLM class oxidoreductase [Kribbella albertanoniae]|uniref:TIGR03557 family F420-dependent LLM class oxidoreductase n=1 Tax=Kribbella albertanoniae TaxID=1266829 RepID=A0A4R4QB11_9ACTN|nr:TIGR03557 family F420-dependent LLM class oxidoreductase [Kribbella albertanoniae]TDC32470.1 TIGR03557 family F420-dependent LLM class oxidoreductase [Kribbella albertanoniae]